MYQGRKPCDLQIRKDQYINHMKKIKQIKGNNSHIHKSLARQKDQINRLMRISHKKHDDSFKMEWKRRELKEMQTNQRSFSNIKSIIEKQVNRKLLTIPIKHKPNTYFLQMQNMKLVNKILTVRSPLKQFIKQTCFQHQTFRLKSKPQFKEDFSQIYEKSIGKSKENKKTIINLKFIERNTKKARIVIDFLNRQDFYLFKMNNLYIIMLEIDNKIKRSKEYELQEILSSSIHLSVPVKNFSVHFLEKVGDRFLKRFKVNFMEQQLLENEKVWTTKSIEDTKDKVIGLVEIQLKRVHIKRKVKYENKKTEVGVDVKLQVEAGAEDDKSTKQKMLRSPIRNIINNL